MDPNGLSSNWKRLQLTFQSQPKSGSSHPDRVKRKQNASATPHARSKRAKLAGPSAMGLSYSSQTAQSKSTENDTDVKVARVSASDQINAGLSSHVIIGQYIAIDCEMVGVGPRPDHESALARVSIVNYNGEQIYDSFVRPVETVTDWRTPVSGIQLKHMTHARTFEQVQKEVSDILTDRVLVGHAIRNDLDALMLSHPRRDIRDTARHGPYRKLAGGSSPKLKLLASELLGLDIQAGEHSSIEDAQASMMLFRRDKANFDKEHAKNFPPQRSIAQDEEAQDNAARSKKKKKKRKR